MQGRRNKRKWQFLALVLAVLMCLAPAAEALAASTLSFSIGGSWNNQDPGLGIKINGTPIDVDSFVGSFNAQNDSIKTYTRIFYVMPGDVIELGVGTSPTPDLNFFRADSNGSLSFPNDATPTWSDSDPKQLIVPGSSEYPSLQAGQGWKVELNIGLNADDTEPNTVGMLRIREIILRPWNTPRT